MGSSRYLFSAFHIRAGDIVYYRHMKAGQGFIDGPYRATELNYSNPAYPKAKLIDIDRKDKVWIESVGVVWLIPANTINTSGFRRTARIPVAPGKGGGVINDD